MRSFFLHHGSDTKGFKKAFFFTRIKHHLFPLMAPNTPSTDSSMHPISMTYIITTETLETSCKDTKNRDIHWIIIILHPKKAVWSKTIIHQRYSLTPNIILSSHGHFMDSTATKEVRGQGWLQHFTPEDNSLSCSRTRQLCGRLPNIRAWTLPETDRYIKRCTAFSKYWWRTQSTLTSACPPLYLPETLSLLKMGFKGDQEWLNSVFILVLWC